MHVRVAGSGGIFAGGGVGPQGTLGLATGLSFGPFHTQAGLWGLLPAERNVANAGHVQLWSLALRLSECALWGQRVQVGPCAGLALLRTSGHSQDFGHDVHRVVLWGALEIGLRALWRVANSFELGLAGGIGTPITPRPRFTVDGAGAVATVPRWSQQAQLELIYLVR
jgi:hypothetical protein